MGFDVMDVFVKVGADISGLEQGLNSAKGMASGLGSAVGTGMKVVGGAIAGATAAVGAFAASSVSVGATFDSSMSQVAATMGVTVDEIGELRQFAQDMGATTAFSATQAADALNYMALAGYDANQSMEMLPNVLNLAAAGDMELARASDMVTDAQTALGLSFEETSEMVDMMAKTASKSNTSVEQMGDAILTVGGTAKSLAGGTNELSTSLGILADNGIKGSEGGTKLRNVILSLSAPTDKAAKALTSLGIETADAEGNLRPLKDIMGELDSAMDGLGSTEKADIISTVFNKTDIAAVNALLDTSSERWDELSSAIDDSAGAAEAMANTQLDNLNGDITLFKSALEGAQILVSDALTPSLREFVQFGTDGLTKVSEGFKEGGLSGAMDAFGEVLSDGIGMITEMLPQAVDAGIQLIGAVGQGLLDNAPAVFDAVVEIGSQLFDTGVELMGKLADGLAEFDWEEAAQNVVDFISNALQSDSVGTFLQTGAKIIYNLINGILTAAPVLVTGIAELIPKVAEGIKTGLPQMAKSASELVKKYADYVIQSAPKMIDAGIDLLMSLADGIIESLPTIIQTVFTLITQLVTLIIQNAPKLLDAGIKLTTKLLEGVVQTLPLILSAFISVCGQILNALIQAGAKWVTGIGTSLKELISTAVKWLSQLPEKMAYYAGAATKRFLTFITELPSKVANGFNNVMQKVIEFGQKFIEEAPKRAKQFSDGLLENLASLPDKMAELGTNLLEGLKRGIENAWQTFVNWIISKAKGIISAFMKGFDEHSPSKEMMKVGVNVVKGLQIGMASEFPSIDNTVSAITDTVTAPISTKYMPSTNNNSSYEANLERADYLDALADAIVRAFTRADITIACDDREFGRLVKRLGVV